MKTLKPQYHQLGRELMEAKIAAEKARAKNENAQADYHLKQLEIIDKKKSLFLQVFERVGKVAATAAPYVLSYLIGMSVLEKYNKISQVQSEDTQLKVRYNEVVNEKQTLAAEIARLKSQNVVFQALIPTNLQGVVLSSNGITGPPTGSSGLFTISTSSQLQCFGGQIPTSQLGQFTMNGNTNIATPASINALTGNQSKLLFQQQ